TQRSWRRRSSWHDRRGMIPRYTRPELGRLWTDEARMEGWRQVEVAACEELPELLGAGNGPSAGELEAIRAASFTVEAVREREFAQVAVGAISGAVGTYAATSPQFEASVLERLELGREDVSTQVVARDRHAELLQAIALAGAGLERLATEIRHLQRTEVSEVQEPFRSGQKG